MENKLIEVMSIVFDVPLDAINENTSPDNLEKWDSLSQLQLIIAIEDTFNIKLEDEDIEKLSDFKSIKQIINKKIDK
jgi:acyl carrier protein|tara:strand:- start:111 stop:341 length:231 start_codon:yes stop_codon:yes gene_type:complete